MLEIHFENALEQAPPSPSEPARRLRAAFDIDVEYMLQQPAAVI